MTQEIKHTAGPWEISKEQYGTFIRFEGGYFLASVQEFAGDKKDQSVANAHLIASAPDLLEACEASHHAKSQAELDSAVKLIEKAIAKAKGGAV